VSKWLGWALGALLAGVFLFVMCPIKTYTPRGVKFSASISNAKQLALVTLEYLADYDDRFPQAYHTNEDLKQALHPYIDNERTFQSINPDGSVFLGNSVLEDRLLSDVADKDNSVLLFDSKDWAKFDGRHCAFADGHAKFIEGFDHRMLEVELVGEEE